MPSKVWAVSSGSYSDYSVHFVCTRREDADAYVAGRGEIDRELFVEEFNLLEQLPPSRTYYERAARIEAPDGAVQELYDRAGEVFEGIDGEDAQVKGDEYDYPSYDSAPASRTVFAEGFDKTGVDKTYAERLARAKYDMTR